MIAGAVGGAALAAWLVATVTSRRSVGAVRRRLTPMLTPATVPVPPRRRVALVRRDAARVGRGDHHGGGSCHGLPIGVSVLCPGGTAGPSRDRPGSLPRPSAGAGGGRRWRSLGLVGGQHRRARSGDAAEALAAACDAIARSLRSGLSLPTAVIDAAARHPTPELTAIARAAQLGRPLPAAIDRVAAEVEHPDGVLVVQVLGVAAEHGGAQAEAIDRAAATLRERAALRAERTAQAASARISTRVMTVLPFGFTGFVAASDADVRHVLLRTPVGWTCVVVGVALNLGGRAWARRAVGA